MRETPITPIVGLSRSEDEVVVEDGELMASRWEFSCADSRCQKAERPTWRHASPWNLLAQRPGNPLRP